MPSLRCRPAEPDDAADLFAWRTDPSTRAVSVNTDEVHWKDHLAWFTTSLRNGDRRICILEDGAGAVRKVGMVRFDRQPDSQLVVVSITVAPAERGRGLGCPMLLAAEPMARAWGSITLQAQVAEDNIGSQRIFEKAGYRHDRDVTDGRRWRFYLKAI